MGSNMLQCFRIPHLDRAGLWRVGVAGVRTIDSAVDDYTSVQVDDGSVFASVPLEETLPSSLVVLGDRVVID